MLIITYREWNSFTSTFDKPEGGFDGTKAGNAKMPGKSSILYAVATSSPSLPEKVTLLSYAVSHHTLWTTNTPPSLTIKLGIWGK